MIYSPSTNPTASQLGGLRRLGVGGKAMYSSQPQAIHRLQVGGAPCQSLRISMHIPFERTSKRRKGFPSETQVKRGHRIVGGEKHLVEKLGRNDPCPCGSGRRFQEMLPAGQPVRGFGTRRLLLGRVRGAPNRLRQAIGHAATPCASARGVAACSRAAELWS
jgi:hypothetical protein